MGSQTGAAVQLGQLPALYALSLSWVNFSIVIPFKNQRVLLAIRVILETWGFHDRYSEIWTLGLWHKTSLHEFDFARCKMYGAVAFFYPALNFISR